MYHEDGSNTTTYYIGDFVRVVNPDGSVEDTDYFRDMDGNLLARQDSDGKKYFYHPDALGSTALVTDEAGNVVEEVEYLPFGEVIEGGNDRYLFTGKEKDRETGLSYYGARFYDPDQAKFIQPDTVQPNVYDPQALNKYAYVRNNPLKYVDESGNYFFFAPLLVGGVTYLTTEIVPIVAPYLQAYTVQQAGEAVSDAYSDPSPENYFWAGFGIYDAVSQGIPERKMAGGVVQYSDEALEAGGKFLARMERTEVAQRAVSDMDRLAHGFSKHGKEINAFKTKSWNKETGKLWKEFNEDIIKNAEGEFYKPAGRGRGQYGLTGYYKNIDGQDIVAYVFSEGPNKGLISHTVDVSGTKTLKVYNVK